MRVWQAILALSAAIDVCSKSIVSPIAVLEIEHARTDCAPKIQEHSIRKSLEGEDESKAADVRLMKPGPADVHCM